MILLFLSLVFIPFGHSLTADSFYPLPTRPPSYHEYLCDPEPVRNGTYTEVYLTPEESWEDAELSISIGIPEFKMEITRQDNEYNPDGTPRIEHRTPDEGYQFLIIPVTITNIGKNEWCFDISRMNLTDSLSGIGYTVDDGMDFLPDPFVGGEISPGDTRKGNVTYEVPRNSSNTEFSVLLDTDTVIFTISKKSG